MARPAGSNRLESDPTSPWVRLWENDRQRCADRDVSPALCLPVNTEGPKGRFGKGFDVAS